MGGWWRLHGNDVLTLRPIGRAIKPRLYHTLLFISNLSLWLRWQGLYASLELLPMWAGIEPDSALFASGRVLDDDGEWAGGQTLGADAAGGERAATSMSIPTIAPAFICPFIGSSCQPHPV